MKRIVVNLVIGIGVAIYIRYLKVELEIARFDCEMKCMKEQQRYEGSRVEKKCL